MLSLSEVNARARESERLCEEALAGLMAAYHLALIKLGRVAVDSFKAKAGHTLVAAGGPAEFPGWNLPDLDELFTLEYGAQVLEETTREARTRLALNATGPWAAETDVAVRSRLTGTVQKLLGERVTEITEHVRQEAATSLRLSQDAGDSIRTASKKLSADFREFAPARARLIARTEMIGASNAASLAMVKETGAASHKRWLATMDSKTRRTHADANGQVVAVDASFSVGGAQLMYPGGSGAPAREVCNCRCTLVYENDPNAPVPPRLGEGVAEPPVIAPLTSEGWTPKLDQGQESAIANYTSNPRVNEVLRGKMTATDETQAEISHISAAMARASSPESVTTYRGAHAAAFDEVGVGGQFREAGFTSTSTDLGKAKWYAQVMGRKTPAILTIHVPAGTRSLYLPDYHKFAFGNQSELLLDKGARFKITSKELVDGVLHVGAELVP